jgi:hypothetical protein
MNLTSEASADGRMALLRRQAADYLLCRMGYEQYVR